MRRATAALGIALTVLVAGCVGRPDARTLLVPTDFATIQAATDEARSGDIIEIQPGVYTESVSVTTDNIVIRGSDRNSVVLDGGHRLSNGIYVAADGVRVENLTVRSFTQNGIIFSGIDRMSRDHEHSPDDEYGTPGHSLVGYEVQWVTAYNNGLYGIYAFASSDGKISDSLVSGHPDSGIYIGQCKPCRAVVRRVVAELNAIGYYGTNASGDVYVIESTFRRNRLGIAPNSQEAEALAPQAETVIVGNVVADNDDPAAPEIPEGFFGGGIIVGGGTKNLIARNRVSDHSYIGIGVIDFNKYLPENNTIEDNVVSRNGLDLVYSPGTSRSALGNCFARNTFRTSSPANIENVLVCGAANAMIQETELPEPVSPPTVDYRRIPQPLIQPTMPTREFARPAGVTPFAKPDVATIPLP